MFQVTVKFYPDNNLTITVKCCEYLNITIKNFNNVKMLKMKYLLKEMVKKHFICKS